jgi:hydrogenase maturation protease
MIILGIGNILQKDDGVGVYAASYLSQNYTFSPQLQVINGGVQGINLFNHFLENDEILILDSIELDDEPASIYAIPAQELGGYGLNSGGAHEIGVIQCLDMLELQGHEIPETMLIGIVPQHVTFEIALSERLTEAFDGYISVILQYLQKRGIRAEQKENPVSLQEIIDRANDPSGVMT